MPRKYQLAAGHAWTGRHGFNEAGADAPEIQDTPLRRCVSSLRFNEAGADAPEIRMAASAALKLPACFNEAGADAPEIRASCQERMPPLVVLQ